MFCEEGYGPACMILGLNLFFKDQERSLVLLEKACDIGYFGNYACYRYAETLERLGLLDEAKKAYQKAYEGGHAVGAVSIELLRLEEGH